MRTQHWLTVCEPRAGSVPRAQLERKLKEKVDPTLADQIDLSQEADAFIG